MNKSELRQLIREAIRESYGSFNDDEHRSKDERSKFLARNSKVNYGFRDYDSDDSRMLGKEEYLSQIQGMSTIEAMIHLIDQGLTEEEAESLVAMLNTDVRDMFNEVADPSALELVGALSTIIGGSLGIKFGMDLLTKIVDKALAAAKYNATEILKIVKDNTAPLKAAAQEGKRAFVKKLMSLIINPTTTTSDYLNRIPKDPPFTIKRNEGTCGYDTDARTGKRFKTPGGL